MDWTPLYRLGTVHPRLTALWLRVLLAWLLGLARQRHELGQAVRAEDRRTQLNEVQVLEADLELGALHMHILTLDALK